MVSAPLSDSEALRGGWSPATLILRLAKQVFDDCLTAYVNSRRPFVGFPQHPLREIHVHTVNGPNDGELGGEVRGDIFTARGRFSNFVSRE